MELTHLRLKALKKLNPTWQVWRWCPAYKDARCNIEAKWQAVKIPTWAPWCIYEITRGKSDCPKWVPNAQELEQAKSKRLGQPTLALMKWQRNDQAKQAKG